MVESGSNNDQDSALKPVEDCRSNTLVITAEHSPECPYEYERLLAFRAREGNPAVPALVVVYDSNSNDKTRCSPCFERDSSGKPCVTNKGRYVTPALI